MRTFAILSVIGATLLVTTAVVAAFPFDTSWHLSSTGPTPGNRAGAGGRYGTGGKTDRGLKCSHCHIKGAGQIGMTVTTVPAFTKKNGDDAYTPGTRYTITVKMTGEHLRAGLTMNNKNGMAAAIENVAGKRAGTYFPDNGTSSSACPQAPIAPPPVGKTTMVYGDCHGVLPIQNQGLTQWVFDWVAPAAGSGDLTMFVGMVDGNSDGDSSLDDDTTEKAIPLREGP